MQQPVLVREYTRSRSAFSQPTKKSSNPSLPPIAAYAFADIIRSADGPEFQSAIDGIADICAKNRLSLAEEHGSHRPPVGEITEASSRSVGPQLRKPDVHRALTSVPEASSGSSEGSEKRKGLFGLRRKGKERPAPMPRVIYIGIARSIKVEGTIAVSKTVGANVVHSGGDQDAAGTTAVTSRSSSAAVSSLQSLLTAMAYEPD